jgi:hypothetical protein
MKSALSFGDADWVAPNVAGRDSPARFEDKLAEIVAPPDVAPDIRPGSPLRANYCEIR